MIRCERIQSLNREAFDIFILQPTKKKHIHCTYTQNIQELKLLCTERMVRKMPRPCVRR